MTVSDLISLLQSLPGDLPVLLRDQAEVGLTEAEFVRVKGIRRGKAGAWDEHSIDLDGHSGEKAVLIS